MAAQAGRGVRASRTDSKREAAQAAEVPAARRPAQKWTLLTSHGRVLLLIAQEPDLRLRDIAELARITERAASGIVSDLEQAGYLTKRRDGRRNSYEVNAEQTFRHPAEAQHRIRELIEVFRHDGAAHARAGGNGESDLKRR